MVVLAKMGAMVAFATLFVGCRFGDFTEDAGPVDAAIIDAAPPVPDAPPIVPDAALPDAGVPDAAGPDVAPSDAGPHSIDPLANGLSTLIGDSAAGFLNGSREFALLSNPVNVLVGPSGDVFVADFGNKAIRQVSPTGETSTLVRQAGFNRPFGMVFTSGGDFYVQTDRSSLDADTGALWRVAMDTGVATLVLDDSGRWRGLAALSDGRIAVGDATGFTIKIFDPVLETVTALAGEEGVAGFGNGTGAGAHFNIIRDVVATSGDVLFVSDSGNNRIRRVTLDGVVTTVAGNGIAASTNGVALASSVNRPSGLALAGDDVLYIGEFNSGMIRKLVGNVLTTVAGSVPGHTDHVDPLQGRFFSAEGIDFVAPNLYSSDGNAGGDEPFHRVRRIVIVAE
tara:strand:+ start:2864 stop:4051 length:1188 start_codon:yes stop_codon:yes gene_type:complete